MKKIQKAFSYTVENATVVVQETSALIEAVSQPRIAILESALTIEAEITHIISHYFFGRVHPKNLMFESLLLNSDACPVSVKRRLLRHIIDEDSLLSGQEKNDLDKRLKDLFSLRNAFAHGTIVTNGKTVWLKYFEGGPQRRELTDELSRSKGLPIGKMKSLITHFINLSGTLWLIQTATVSANRRTKQINPPKKFTRKGGTRIPQSFSIKHPIFKYMRDIPSYS